MMLARSARYALLLTVTVPGIAAKADEKSEVQSEATQRYLDRIYAPSQRSCAFRASDAPGAVRWRSESRPVLARLLGLDRIAEQAGGFTPSFRLRESEDMGKYTRQFGVMIPEPDVTIPFWLFRPQGHGPFPLGIFPHGHGEWALYAGIAADDATRRKMDDGEKDVAIQAVRRGFLAIALATRGLGAAGVPDLSGRYGGRDCRSQMIHCLMARRTAVGERVWDVQRMLDWAEKRHDVDAQRVLVMGNSGGGVVTLYTAAIDRRVKTAVCAGAFTTLIRSDGRAHHCDCNTVPGILSFGDFPDVAGLVAPRALLTVNGDADSLFLNADVDRAAARLHSIYALSGAAGKYAHRYGHGGHRFYSKVSWPFVGQSLLTSE